MIVENDLYECTKCRLSFDSKNELQTHFNLKHTINLKNKQFFNEQINTEQEGMSNNKFLNQINQIENEMINGFKFIEEELISSSEEMKVNTIQKNINFINEENLDIGTVYSSYEEVEEINLKNKNLTNFNDNSKKPFFEKLSSVVIINISKNVLIHIDDIQKIKSVRYLNISFNKITNIIFVDNLINLETLIANNNEINSISSLVGLKNLKILDVHKNKISYNISTMKTLGNIKSLKELRISDNPFLKDYIGYKHTFINKFRKLEKLDDEEITEMERDIAKEYLKKFGDNTDKNEHVERPKTAKSILNIRSITNTCKNQDDVILEKEETEEIESVTAENFFPRQNEIKEDNKTNDESKNVKVNEIKIDDLKEKYDQINIKFEEVPRLSTIPKSNNSIKMEKSNLITNKNERENSNSLKKDNQKLKEEVEFLKSKLSSYETVIESQKIQIDNLYSNPDFNKKKTKKNVLELGNIDNQD